MLACMSDKERPPLVPGQVRVVVERARRDRDVLTTDVRVVEGQADDLESPASMFKQAIGDGLDLHRCARATRESMTFLTFGNSPEPTVGDECVIQWWWIPGTQQILRDAPGWTPRTVEEHWFCPLTYENLEVGEVAYTDGRGHWISVSGWEKFVRDDVLRLRVPLQPAESAPDGRLGADEFLSRLREAYPSYAAVDDEEAADWDDEPVPHYLRVGRLAFHLADIAVKEGVHALAPALTLAEDGIERGDGYTRELATVGLLEDIQNACLRSKPGIRLLDVRALLGPKSMVAWDDLMTFWHGAPDEARRRLPPGSIPDPRQ